MMDVVVRHWSIVMVESAEERSSCRQEGRHKNDPFYVDDGMVASLDPRWLQGDFITLVGLFNRVGLKTNIGKTVEMVCHLCQAAVTQLAAEYRRRMTVAGTFYR